MLKPWMIIGAITLLIDFGSLLIRPRDIRWASKLDRPNWLFFEPAIPFIWTAIFICGAWSATLVWNHNPDSLRTWLLMGLYLFIEVVTVAYIPATLRSRNLTVGTVLGGTGFILSLVLWFLVQQVSGEAALLLLPYVVWSPVGTYATRQMMDLNPEAAS